MRDQLGHLSLKELVMQRIRKQILEGQVELGSRLVETAIAEEFGVSRGPVREAFLDLAREGLLVINPRRGASVSTLAPDDIWQIYTLRAHLESLVFQHALKRMTESDFKALEGLAEEMGEVVNAGAGMVARATELDLAFHSLIAARCPYQRIVEAYHNLDGQVGAGIYTVVKLLNGTLVHMKDKHMAVIRAMRTGDLTIAQAAVQAHWMETADKIRGTLRRQKGEAR